MAKPDPALLVPERYPHSLEIATRYADLDPNRHINNIAMAAMFEDSRARFHGLTTLPGRSDRQPMVASFAIEYLNQAYYPQPIRFHAAVRSIGRTSLHLIQYATQADKPVAFATTVMVLTEAGRPAPLAPDDIARLNELMLRP